MDGKGAGPGRTGARTRIQRQNEERILDAALAVFSADGFRGATVDRIAESAGMSKPNLLYYFGSKEAVYRALLARLLDGWLEPLRALDPAGEPLDQIRRYARRKLQMSRDYPRESRLFAGEMLRGAPVMGAELAGPLRELVEEKAAVIQRWIDDGRLAAHDPRHLIFAIWATTQHYADFDVQVRAVLGQDAALRFDEAGRMLDLLFGSGLRPD